MSAARTMRLSISGALGIGNNVLRLRTFDAPPSGIAFFFFGPPSQRTPLASGWLCTGPPSFELAPPLQVSPTGFVEHSLDFTVPPLSDGPSAIHPGTTWSFQLLCRDPRPQATGPRISDGLSILFPP